MKNQNGSSLMEIVVGLSLTMLIVWAATTVLGQMMNGREATTAKGDSEIEAFSLLQLVEKVGRLATSCTKNITDSSLECEVDFNNNGITDDPRVRFYLPYPAQGMVYQHFAAGVWTTKLTFPSVESFVLCSDFEMKNSACAIENKKISQTVLNPTGRFFRFQLSLAPQAKAARGLKVSLQSGFYVRNPAPRNMKYAWGSTNL